VQPKNISIFLPLPVSTESTAVRCESLKTSFIQTGCSRHSAQISPACAAFY